jgi:lipocalin-like protein
MACCRSLGGGGQAGPAISFMICATLRAHLWPSAVPLREELVNTHGRVVVIGLVLLVSCGGVLGHASTQNKKGAREQIVGAWQLESRTVRKASGEILLDPVLGKQPIGRLVYDVSGHMMLQMMRQDRAQAISVPSNPQNATNARIVLGYDAYFGTFQVNDADGTITHHVEGSLFPEDLGKDFRRLFRIEGDTFTLSFTSRAPEGFDVTRTLRFRRSK